MKKRTFLHVFRVPFTVLMALVILSLLIPIAGLIFMGDASNTMSVGEFYLRLFAGGCCLAFAMLCWTDFV